MTTYCTDADILLEDPDAQKYLPKSEQGAGVFTRIREQIKKRIDAGLAARTPPIEPSDVDDTAILLDAEVYGVLAELLFKSASKAGGDGTDWYTQEAMRYQQMMQAKIEGPITTKTDTVVRVGSIRLRRC